MDRGDGRALADAVQDMWVNFATTGSPDTDTVQWEPYNSETRVTMVLGEEIRAERDIKGEQRRQIEPLLGYYLNGCYAQLDWATPHTLRICAQLLAALLLLAAVVVRIVRALRKKARRTKKGAKESS